MSYPGRFFREAGGVLPLWRGYSQHIVSSADRAVTFRDKRDISVKISKMKNYYSHYLHDSDYYIILYYIILYYIYSLPPVD